MINKKAPKRGFCRNHKLDDLGILLLAAASLTFALSRAARLLFFRLLGFSGFLFLLLFIANTRIAAYCHGRYEHQSHEYLFHRNLIFTNSTNEYT